MSDQQERWDIYVVNGTKEVVRDVLEPGETLSEFVRVALAAELERREQVDT
jgi:hypothetical protein